MTNPLVSSQVYRFRDYVAFALRSGEGSGPTVYLTSGEARAIAAALIKAADSVDSESFTSSNVGTIRIQGGATDERRIYRIVRHFRDHDKNRIGRQLFTLAEAQAHCRDPNTSSSTATDEAARRLTTIMGPWFDGYEIHPKFRKGSK